MFSSLSRLVPVAITLIVVGFCVLGFYSLVTAAPAGQPPFANSVEQRAEMIAELREIKELLKEQNTLLRQVGKTDGRGKTP